MRRRPLRPLVERGNPRASSVAFDPAKWLTAEQAAAYLGKFRRKDGQPSVGAVRNLVYRGRIRAYKPFGRLLFNRIELESQIETSLKGG